MQWSITLSLLFFCFFTYQNLIGQTHRCAWDHIQQSHIQSTGEKYRSPKSTSLLPSNTEASALVTIPVIFHIIHDGKSIGVGENVAQNLIVAQLEQLNDDFRRLNADAGNTPSMFLSLAADVEIEFCLAQRDPNGYPTTGVQRYNFGISQYTPEQFKHVVQSRTTWNRDEYLNIWIADLNGYLGYAYLPGGEAIGDGLTIDYITVGSLSTPNPFNSPFKYGRTATHEIGHWLGLDHHWATPNDCFSDDGVFDTPRQFSFYTGQPNHPQSSCSSTDMFMNFLDYVDDAAMNMYSHGQKSVMHSVLNSIRSGLKTSSACQPVQPAIMFSQPLLANIEGTASCNSGNSRTIQVEMKIATAPSRTATVNIQTSGSAQLGKDYSLSRSSLSFFAGSSVSQYFDIIIHEDAYLENFEDFQLSYSLNSGGGNAVKGSNNQTLDVQLIDDDFEAAPYEMMDEDVGANHGSATASSPFRASSKGTRMQMIYTKDDLLNAGLTAGFIHSVSFYLTEKRSAIAYNDFHLKMALTNQFEFGDYANFTSGFTTTYSGSPFTVAGKMKFDLDQQFYWDGHSNLILETCYSNSGTSSDDKVRFENTAGSNTVLVEQSNTIPGCLINFMPSKHTLRPVIAVQLEHGQEVAIHQNSTNGYSECDLDAQQTVNFYDETSGEVMLSIKNLDNHNYGCTKVEIDRDGNGAYSLWGTSYESTGKTFKISPEFNSANGRYEISFFFSKNEVDTWVAQNRLGSDITDLRLTKCDGSIVSSAPGQCDSYPLTRSSHGADYKFTTTISNGFSGFTLSNWTSGFLSLHDAKLNGLLENRTAHLELDFSGKMAAGDSIVWLRTTHLGSEIIKREPLIHEHTELSDVIPPFVSNVDYSVEVIFSDQSVLTSNPISLELPQEWQLYHDGQNWKFINDAQSSEVSVHNLQGVELLSLSLDEFEEINLDFGDVPRQMVIVKKQSGSSVEIRKLIL